jgi:PAS domain S-box-containing protein
MIPSSAPLNPRSSAPREKVSVSDAKETNANGISQGAKDGIWIIGAYAHTVYANERMAEILGTSPSEMVGHPSFSYVFPEDMAHAQRLFDGKKTGDINPFHFKLRREDGSVVWVDVQGTPMYNAAGVFKGSISNKISWRRGSESNRRIKVLQTLALPLGYRA